MFLTLGFAPGNDALPLQSAKLRRDDRETVFGVAAVAKDHHPIASLALLMCTRCIGK